MRGALALLGLLGCGKAPAEPAPVPAHSFPEFGELRVFGASVQELSEAEALVAVEAVPEPYFTELVVVRTADGGHTWERTLHDAEGSVVGWFALDARHVWLSSQVERAGLTPQIHSSADGGRTWTLLAPPETGASMARLDTLRFADPRQGIVHHDSGGWFVTDDGGRTWTKATEPLADDRLHLTATPSFDGGDVVRVREDGDTVVIERRAPSGWETARALPRYRP